MLKVDKVILDGDLNFVIGEAEIWVPHAHRENLTDYFIIKLEEFLFLTSFLTESILLGRICA
jgi:hypothetical protein